LNFTVTGGQVHDSDAIKEGLSTARPPLAVSADKTYDSKEARQQIKDEGASLASPAAAIPPKMPTGPTASIASAIRSKTFFCRIRASEWRRGNCGQACRISSQRAANL
jgi:hypothetical protein